MRARPRALVAPALTVLLAGAGSALFLAVLVLLVLLAALPGRPPFLANTISRDAYGPHGGLVFPVLLLFGLGTALFALCLGLRLRGTAGATCALLTGVLSVAAVYDAFVRTPAVHTGTAFGQVHTLLAVAGIVSQLVVALLFASVVRRRRGRLPPLLGWVTALVLAGVVFVAVHPNSLAGLSERLLFAASALWMLTSAHTARLCPPTDAEEGAAAGSALGNGGLSA
jgi:hypothetical protein